MLDYLAEKKYIVVSLSTTVVILFISFISVLIILLIKNTTPQKNNSEPLVLNKIIYTPESSFITETYSIKKDQCQNSVSAYEYFIPTSEDDVQPPSKNNCIILYSKKSNWLVDFFVKNMGYIVIIPSIAETPEDIEHVLDRIFQKKDSDKGLDPDLIDQLFFIGNMGEKGSLEEYSSKFNKIILFNSPKKINIKEILYIDTYYDCQLKKDNLFVDQPVKNCIRVLLYGTLSEPKFYSTSCNFLDGICEECSTSSFILGSMYQKSIALLLIELYLTSNEKLYRLLHTTQKGILELSEIKIHKSYLTCLSVKD
jgi:hypothetical protein